MSFNYRRIKRSILSFFGSPSQCYADFYNVAAQLEAEGKKMKALSCYKTTYDYLNKYIKSAERTNIDTFIDKKNKELIKAKIIELGGNADE